MISLSPSHVDALNIAENYFGGTVTGLDLFVAAIDRRIVRDLVDMGLMRRRLVGWEVTYRGQQELEERDITCYTDTRTA